MINKMERQYTLDKYPNFPRYDPLTDEYFFPKIHGAYILTLTSAFARGHAKAVSAAFIKLIRYFQIDFLIFLGEAKTAWRHQDNDYKPVKEALQYLQDNKLGKNFNGALRVDTNDLGEFTKHLFWLARCNASLPIFHFIDDGQNIVGSICQYGNIHISVLNKTSENLLMQAVNMSGFRYLPDESCAEPFGKTGIIKQRQIIV
jgi:hypothetical protein